MPKGYPNLYPPIFDICHCGCGQIVYGGKRFIRGHANLNPEIKKKNIESHLGHICSIETRRKISIANSGKNNGMYGKSACLGIPKSEETKRKISQKLKGRKLLKETIEKMKKNRVGMLGKRHSEETRKKISKRLEDPEIKRKQSEPKIGENNPQWIDGRSYFPYCPKFNKRLKNEIKKRDNYQCQNPNCFTTQLESLVIYGKGLHVHHVHYDGKNCYPDLITLCPLCNLKANKNRKYWEGLYMKILEKRNLLNWKSQMRF